MEPLNDHEDLFGALDEAAYNATPPTGVEIDQAAWHVRMCNLFDREAAAVAAMYDTEIVMFHELKQARLETLASRRRWHETAVSQWHRAGLADGTLRKTVQLPTGSSSLRAAQPAAEVVDEDTLRAWLANNNLEETAYPAKEPKLSIGALKKLVKPQTKEAEPGSTVQAVYPETGEPVPGIIYHAKAAGHNVT